MGESKDLIKCMMVLKKRAVVVKTGHGGGKTCAGGESNHQRKKKIKIKHTWMSPVFVALSALKWW